MKSDKLFLDANVLLEVLLDRRLSGKVRVLLAQHEGEFFISALTAHLVVHFCSSNVGFGVVDEFLMDYKIIGLEESDFKWAFSNMEGNDFEDALQVSCAIRSGCTQMVTLDKPLSKRYDRIPLDIRLLS